VETKHIHNSHPPTHTPKVRLVKADSNKAMQIHVSSPAALCIFKLTSNRRGNGNAVCIARREVGERRQLAVGEPFGTDGGANSWRLPAGRAARQGRAAPTGSQARGVRWDADAVWTKSSAAAMRRKRSPLPPPGHHPPPPPRPGHHPPLSCLLQGVARRDARRRLGPQHSFSLNALVCNLICHSMSTNKLAKNLNIGHVDR
jgi:hypothetical protein